MDPNPSLSIYMPLYSLTVINVQPRVMKQQLCLEVLQLHWVKPDSLLFTAHILIGEASCLDLTLPYVKQITVIHLHKKRT